MSTFAPSGSAPADPASTPSESTAPSTDSPTPPDDRSPSEVSEATDTHDPNITWGDDDPDKPEGWVAP